MVRGLILPDVIGALINVLQTDPDVAALTGQRVPAGQLPRVASAMPEVPATDPRHWHMPDYAILVRRAGGRGADPYTDIHYARVDIRCFGPGATINVRRRTADDLWRTMNPVLCPPPNQGIVMGWRAKRTMIQAIQQEAEPIPLQENGTDWPLVLCSYIVIYMGTRLAA